MAKSETSQTYGSSDLWLCAYLKSQGMKLTGTEREGRRCVFLFEDRADRERLVLDFFNKGVVEVNSYRHALDDLKSLVCNF